MSTSANKPGSVAIDVIITDESLIVALNDGRSLSVPLKWYPRLVHGTYEERSDWRLMPSGQGIHWEQLDEDISVEGLIAGRPSGESETSLRKWLAKREAI